MNSAPNRPNRPIESQGLLVRTLRCPVCRNTGLIWTVVGATCSSCAARVPLVDGIAVCLGGGHADLGPHKMQQSAFFDTVAPEWEIERPRTAPSLYRWLLEHKHKRSVRGIKGYVRGHTAITICGGSGMDAEFLAGLGAEVINSDISLEAARRATIRAQRHHVSFEPIVADAEALPFPDRSIDLVYVHDGLHHLEQPLSGLAEIARVARCAVSINEPARAGVTRVAIRIGLAEEREEAGNPIARLVPSDIEAFLVGQGFRIVRSERYGLFYRHEPGRIARWLSYGPLPSLAKAAVIAFNVVLGRIGNKLTVQAVREWPSQ